MAINFDKLIRIKMTVESFNQVFDVMLHKYSGNMTDAYEATEHEHQVRCKTRKYKDFESFRVARSRYLNTKK